MMNNVHEHFDTRRLNAIPITEVAQHLGCTLHKMGSVQKTSCPWHEDKHPSLTLYERTEENRCHCFACGNGGSVIDFVMKQENWSFQQACQWLSSEFCISTQQQSGQIPRPKPQKPPVNRTPNYTYIPQEMVGKLVSTENSLCHCLMQMFHPEAVEWLTEEYQLGCYAMRDHDDYTVFPSIDIEERVCNLKIQHYDTDLSSAHFAHSDKGSCLWLGSIWAREGRLPHDAVFRSECMFGEHLLSRHPNSIVALVESPKNALFGALSYPQMTWLATGNKTMLKREVLKPLLGRDVIVIPDRDAIREWQTCIGGMSDIANFTVSDFCERAAPEGELKFDIADYLQQKSLLPF